MPLDTMLLNCTGGHVVSYPSPVQCMQSGGKVLVASLDSHESFIQMLWTFHKALPFGSFGSHSVKFVVVTDRYFDLNWVAAERPVEVVASSGPDVLTGHYLGTYLEFISSHVIDSVSLY